MIAFRLVMLAILLAQPACMSPNDRALLRELPQDAYIRYRKVTEYNVTHRARFIGLR